MHWKKFLVVLSNLINKNLHKKYTADVVTSIGTLPIFPDPTKFINLLLDLVKKKE